MDLGFLRFDALRSGASPVPLDYFRLTASLAALQAASRTAAVEAALAAGTFANGPAVGAIVRLFDAGAGWAGAVTTLHGSFHPALADGGGARP